jgi:flagella basal body P-ring formation protein FlgA
MLRSFAILVLLPAIGGGGPRADFPSPVIVTLRPTVTVQEPRVHVGHVATLQGGDPSLRDKIAQLDLVELNQPDPVARITPRQVAFRLQLADVDQRQFRVEGPEAVQVRLTTQQTLEERIATAARQAILDRLPGRSEDVSVQQVLPIRFSPLPGVRPEDLRLETEVRSPIKIPGRTNVEVGIWEGGKRRAVVSVLLDVRAYQQVAVVLRHVESGETISADLVRLERRLVEGGSSAPLPGATVIGSRAKHLLMPGQTIGPGDVETKGSEGPILVKQRSPIRLVVCTGTLEVTARGEALQDGRAGQVIRVRNVDSRKELSGRVVDSGTVAVELFRGSQP